MPGGVFPKLIITLLNMYARLTKNTLLNVFSTELAVVRRTSIHEILRPHLH